ncbi:MAG TPA: sulfur carrier protein ThiS [Thermoanaerobaculia bacterium]|jgi:thiamine biosynthesis protein ThiS|nr:sulfur carrier protein ThiS [Thermoanaerobaculia bacterium]
MPEIDTATLEILLNGEPHRLAAGPAGVTVLDLLAGLGRDPRTVAVERNGEIVRRADYAETRLQPGDRLEVVHFVQGG